MNKLNKITPVILCGGSGTRLWPLSRTSLPKQFITLTGEHSLFQETVIRLNSLKSANFLSNEQIIVTNEDHRFFVQEQHNQVSKKSSKIILEPFGLNTAPALTFAAMESIRNNEDSILVVSPSDHKIDDNFLFTKKLENAISCADKGEIIILGIPPNNPNTGFGYIKVKGNKSSFEEYKVEKFIEKPTLEKAMKYLDSPYYRWNSGIFVLRASLWLKALNFFRRDIFDAASKSFKKKNEELNFIRPDSALFAKIPAESIDYAVIEKCPNSQFSIKMIEMDIQWSDLGSWDAVWQSGDQDTSGNVSYGDVLIEHSKNNLIFSDHRLIAAYGVDNLAIIETADAILVGDKNKSQYMVKIVEKLTKNGREEKFNHRKVFRPWGWYDTVDIGDCFKVKRIKVQPGASLSLQKHHKRAEHWVVIRGEAHITVGERNLILKENESTYIPLGVKHRLSNPSSTALEIIEVQTGKYVGEDDITRYEDKYKRI